MPSIAIKAVVDNYLGHLVDSIQVNSYLFGENCGIVGSEARRGLVTIFDPVS